MRRVVRQRSHRAQEWKGLALPLRKVLWDISGGGGIIYVCVWTTRGVCLTPGDLVGCINVV